MRSGSARTLFQEQQHGHSRDHGKYQSEADIARGSDGAEDLGGMVPQVLESAPWSASLQPDLEAPDGNLDLSNPWLALSPLPISHMARYATNG